MLAGSHAPGTYENRPLDLMNAADLLDYSCPLGRFGRQYYGRQVLPNAWAVCRNSYYWQLIDLPELRGSFSCRSRHPTELMIHPEESLKADPGIRILGRVDLDPFLGLNSLVQAVTLPWPQQPGAGRHASFYPASGVL